MNRYLLIGVTLIGILPLAVIGTSKLAMFRAATSDVSLMSVVVVDESIKIKGSFTGSQMWYDDSHTEYRNGSLYITIVGSMIKFPGMKGDPFTISIPNTYGPIKTIYLQGSSPSDQKLIWSAPEQPTQ